MLTETSRFLVRALRAAAVARTSDECSAKVELDEEASLLLVRKGLGACTSYDSVVLTGYRELSRALWRCQLAELRKVLAALVQAGCEPILMKGVEIGARWFETLPLCFRGDLDMLVAEEHRSVAKQCLQEMGYCQGVLDIKRGALESLNPEAVRHREEGNYNLVSFGRVFELPGIVPTKVQALFQAGPWSKPVFIFNDRVYCVVAIDIASGLDSNIPMTDVAARAIPSAVGAAAAMSVTDTLWYCLALLYLEVVWHGARTRLFRLAELSRIIRQSSDVDWLKLVDMVERLELRPNAYYILRFLQQIGCISPPPIAMQALNPELGSRTRDYGWQLHRLFGETEPFPNDFLHNGRAEIPGAALQPSLAGSA